MMAAALYVILRHEGIPRPHFDLMFQTSPGSKLATWRADAWRPTAMIDVEKLDDHRQAYLTFEGKISGDRGEVRRVEQGICSVERTGETWRIELTPLPSGEKFVLTIQKRDGKWKAQGTYSSDPA